MSRVSVFGIGYVGCVSAACLARDGHQVIGVDVDADKVGELNAGYAPIAEPGLPELVRAQVQAGNLRGTRDVEEAVLTSEIGLITVGTPSNDNGDVSTRAVEQVVAAIGRTLRQSARDFTVVVRSTLLPGILEERLAPLLQEAAGRPLGRGLDLANNPEFLRESSAIRDYDDPPFVLVGADHPRTAQAVLALYEQIAAERVVTDPRTAALVKYGCNAFHALKVAFANELGSLARSFGVDGAEILGLLCRDRRLNISTAYLRPGFAFGGSCLPKDLRALTRYAEREALRLDLLASILPSNEDHLRRAVRLIQGAGHRKIGIIGLSFKPGTDDLRESPLVILVETLLGRGFDIKILDPGISVSRLRGRNLAYIDRHLPHLAALLVEDVAELAQHASLLVLGSDVADSLDWRSGYTGAVIDLRRDLTAGRPAASESQGASDAWLEPTGLHRSLTTRNSQ
ncbi:MAG TPA: nucleotide sugar dehydrogenase [Isosphaeraceae bacterium]|nr:nucleotide sugar dehydrogenase [Isosphaeraceae bacterium]